MGKSAKIVSWLLTGLCVTTLFAGQKKHDAPNKETNNKAIEESVVPTFLALEPDKKAQPPRYLATENKEADLEHYKKTERRFGVDVGMAIPMGDFQKDFSTAPLLGLHFVWGAIEPFDFCVSSYRASTSHKNGPALGKLTMSSIAVGTTASFPMTRFVPFAKVEATLNFNDVSLDAARVPTAGNDGFITTVGVNAGVGWDFIVGREVSAGIDATYHYSIPKKITLSNSTMYDLGSSYASVALRLNF